MGSTIQFPANGGTCSGYLSTAKAGPGSPRGIVVIQEWWGLNDQIKGVADWFAAEGFTALTPDLYRGTVTKSPDEAGKLLMALDIARAEKDLRGAIDHLRGLTGKPVGVVGYCMGGALSLYAAGKNGPNVGACVVYYGGHPKITFDFDALTAPVLGHWAEDDDFANRNRDLAAAELEKRGKRFEFHTYPGTKHGFANQEGKAYHPAAAEESGRRTLDFFRSHL